MERFVARQPIFNRKNDVVAYELLFRSGHEDNYDGIDGDKATMNVISNSFYSSDLKTIINDKRVFINFTEKLIKEELATILPPKRVIVEILENVEPNSEIIAACKNLKSMGFILALDDFVFHEKYKKLIELADIIKVDFRITKGFERKKIFNILKINKKLKFLAEKVETIDEYNEAMDLGYTYFQGYYFSKPVILSTKHIPSHKCTALKTLDLLNKENIDLNELENLILRDVGLSYKIMRLINSSAYSIRNKITSIKYALAFLGEKEIIKWLYVVLLNDLKETNSDEIMKVSLQRAKFCEEICNISGFKEKVFIAYITGLFSVIDAILNCSMEIIIKEIYLPNEVKDALIGNENILSKILDLTVSYEKGEWNKVIAYSDKIGIDMSKISKIYFNSLEWSKEINFK